MGSVRADVVVVDAESRDETPELVAGFPGVRLLRCRNGGFAYANNRGLMTCDARYVLFLNPDTEILDGSLSGSRRAMDARPEVGLVGASAGGRGRPLGPDVRLSPTRFARWATLCRQSDLPARPRWLGERELDPAAYDHELACDWTSGSFMLARREAIESAGFMDERFFMYSEETDFCRRIKSAGWDIRHFPWMTILHYGAEVGVEPGIESLIAHSRMLYARKHFSRTHRALYLGTLFSCSTRSGLSARAAVSWAPPTAAHRAALRDAAAPVAPPHSPWSRFSVRPRESTAPPTVVRLDPASVGDRSRRDAGLHDRAELPLHREAEQAAGRRRGGRLRGPAQFVEILDVVPDRTTSRLTFDDGNSSDVTEALPELVGRGLEAQFFICPARFGTAGFVDEDDVRELRRGGHVARFARDGSRALAQARALAIDREIVQAKRLLEDTLQAPVETAAVRSGHTTGGR